MSGEINDVSELLGKLQGTMDSIKETQNRHLDEFHKESNKQGEKLDALNKTMVTVQMNHEAIEGRFSKYEKEFNIFKKNTDLDLKALKEDTQKRLAPLETLNDKYKWAMGGVYTVLGLAVSGIVSKFMGLF